MMIVKHFVPLLLAKQGSAKVLFQQSSFKISMDEKLKYAS